MLADLRKVLKVLCTAVKWVWWLFCRLTRWCVGLLALLIIMTTIIQSGRLIDAAIRYTLGPGGRLEAAIRRGETVIPLTELIGQHWTKVCIMPAGGYLSPSNSTVTQKYLNQLFGLRHPYTVANDWGFWPNLYFTETWVALVVWKPWWGQVWWNVGDWEKQEDATRDKKTPVIWTGLVPQGGEDLIILCTSEHQAKLIWDGHSTVSWQGFTEIFIPESKYTRKNYAD